MEGDMRTELIGRADTRMSREVERLDGEEWNFKD